MEISSKTMSSSKTSTTLKSSSKTSTKNLTLAKVNDLGIKIPKIPKSTYNLSSLFAAGMSHRSEETYQVQVKEKQKQIENLQKEMNSFNDSTSFLGEDFNSLQWASKETNMNPFSMA